MKHLLKILKNKLKQVSHAGVLEASPEELTVQDVADFVNNDYDQIIIIGINHNNEE